MDETFEARGTNGSIDVSPEAVTIRRDGSADVIQPLTQPVPIWLSGTGLVGWGYLRIGVPGEIEATLGNRPASQDPRTVMYDRKQSGSFLRARDLIVRRMAKAHADQPGMLARIGQALASSVFLTYLGGHPDCATRVEVVVTADATHVNVHACTLGGARPLFSIPKTDLVNVSLAAGSTRSLGKAATGAIIGGVLTGGLGLLAGAAIGGQAKDASLILMDIKYGPATLEVVFGGQGVRDKYPRFVSLLR